MTANAKRAVVRLERIIPGPRHSVYRAWLERDLIRRWMAPGNDVTRVEIDERVGGPFRVWHASSGSDVGGFDCVILELVPDELIAFRWGFVGPERREGPAYDSVLTITLRDVPGGATSLTLVHEHLDELAAALPQVADKVELGWAMVLEQLAIVIGPRTAGRPSASGRQEKQDAQDDA